jgi:hypothetical protein
VIVIYQCRQQSDGQWRNIIVSPPPKQPHEKTKGAAPTKEQPPVQLINLGKEQHRFGKEIGIAIVSKEGGLHQPCIYYRIEQHRSQALCLFILLICLVGLRHEFRRPPTT